MKTILVPTDFSIAAKNASEYAINIAKITNSKIILFHAYSLPILNSLMLKGGTGFQNSIEEHLVNESNRLIKQTGVEVSYLVKMGSVVDEILKAGESSSLIIMGIKGTNIVSETLIGSTATTILQKSKIPVLIIPENAKYKKPEKIVFACDYNPLTDVYILDALKGLMKSFDSKILVVDVKHKKESVSVEESITGMKLDNKLNDVEHIFYFPENADLVEGINEFVEGHHADMIAVIPHRHNLLERLFHKSNSKKMAFHTHVPLLALPDNHKTVAAYFS